MSVKTGLLKVSYDLVNRNIHHAAEMVFGTFPEPDFAAGPASEAGNFGNERIFSVRRHVRIHPESRNCIAPNRYHSFTVCSRDMHEPGIICKDCG